MPKMSLTKKLRLKNSREIGSCEIDDFCKKYGFECFHFTEYHMRLNGKVDVYPTGRKYYDIKTREWGVYRNLEEILTKIK